MKKDAVDEVDEEGRSEADFILMIGELRVFLNALLQVLNGEDNGQEDWVQDSEQDEPAESGNDHDIYASAIGVVRQFGQASAALLQQHLGVSYIYSADCSSGWNRKELSVPRAREEFGMSCVMQLEKE